MSGNRHKNIPEEKNQVFHIGPAPISGVGPSLYIRNPAWRWNKDRRINGFNSGILGKSDFRAAIQGLAESLQKELLKRADVEKVEDEPKS